MTATEQPGDVINMAVPHGKSSSFHPVIRVGLGATAIVVIALGINTIHRLQQHAHIHLLSQVPMGSSPGALDRMAQRSPIWGGTVVEWAAPPAQVLKGIAKRARVTTEHGTYYQVELGEYGEWSKSHHSKASFTGVITLYMDRRWSEPVALQFTFIAGRLVKKEWGLMPG